MPQYQGVWTLEQQAQALTNQQWVTDPNFKNTTLLLQADGTGSGSQNQTFLDGSTNNFFITRNGNTTQGSFSPFSQAPGYWSDYFNGSSDYLTAPNNAAFNFGTGSVTIDAWVYPSSITDGMTIFDSGTADNSGRLLICGSTSNRIRVRSNATDFITSTVPITLNTWTLVTFVRNGTSCVLYFNGVNVTSGGSVTNSGNWNGANCYIGRLADGAGGYFSGYISNLRVVNGTAVYTSAFTPQTTPLTAITNTSVLTCQSNRFIDNSTNAFAITINGTPSVQAFSPFAPALQWTPDVVGGSGYFDGTGDYLVVSSNANLSLGSSDFTIELWWYPTGFSADGEIFSMSSSGGTSRCYSMYTVNSNGKLEAYAGTGGGSWDIINALNMGTYVRNQWNHIAFTRSGSTFNTYLNGVRISTTTSSGTLGSANLGIGANNAGGGAIPASYMSARTIKGTALYTGSTYTIPTTPFSAVSNTNFLLGCTNAGIYDGKMANNLETVGNAQVATSPVKYGSGSMYFDGTGDYLVSPAGQNYEIGAGDFTLECWVYGVAFSSSNGGSGIIAKGNNTSTSGEVYSLQCSSGTLNFYSFNYSSGTPVASGPFNLPTNAWSHVAVARANGITRVFINGISGTAGTAAYTVTAGGNFYVGTQAYTPGDSTRSLNGYIDDLRITKGIARYIANFTPPQQALPRQ